MLKMKATPQSDDESENSHIENIRSNYDTTNLAAIMGRLKHAIDWREY